MRPNRLVTAPFALAFLSAAAYWVAPRVEAVAPYLPWTALDVERPGPFAERKLKRVEDDPGECRAVLARLGAAFSPGQSRPVGENGCGLPNAVRLASVTADYRPALDTRCRIAAGLGLWEKDVVQPAAAEHLGTGVRAIRHYSSFSCRAVRGSRTGRLSQHATANAVDIAGFDLEDGRRVTVVNDWGTESAEALFLEAVHEGACGIFKGVLGPDYNEAHRDHFHFDLGPYNICR